MPRLVRIHRPGLVHQIIARVVNGEFRIDADARREYLRRLGVVVSRTEWVLLGYAIMSNHIHLAALAGADPSSRLIQPLHTGFALWLNRRQGRSGHVFAGRHATYAYDTTGVVRLLAYLHNNPVRAAVVESPEQTDWTSHRAFIGAEPCPSFLRADCAYAIMNCTPAEFDETVALRSNEPRDATFSSARTASVVARARKDTAAPVELGTPIVQPGMERAEYPVLSRSGGGPRPPFHGSPADVLEAVARHTGLEAKWIRGRRKWREAVAGRRLALLVWRELGRAAIEMSAELSISNGAASHLVRDVAKQVELELSTASIVHELSPNRRK